MNYAEKLSSGRCRPSEVDRPLPSERIPRAEAVSARAVSHTGKRILLRGSLCGRAVEARKEALGAKLAAQQTPKHRSQQQIHRRALEEQTRRAAR